jgi:LysM repeat protein
MASLNDIVEEYLKGENYTIQAGDTLTKIGGRYGMSAKQLWEFEGDTGSANSTRIGGTWPASAKTGVVIVVPKLPATVAAAEGSVTIPDDIAAVMQEQWEKSIAIQNKTALVAPSTVGDFNLIYMDQNAKEYGGILTWVLATKKLEFIRKGSGNAGSYSIDLALDPARYILGSLHTHPYTRFVDGDDKEDVAFSGTDLAVYMEYTAFLDFVQSGDTRFLCMRTKNTSRRSATAKKANTEWTAGFTIADYKRQTYVDSVMKITKKICTNYDQAFYADKGKTLSKKN